MPADLALFNQTCLLGHWKLKRKAIWLMPFHKTCQLKLWNFISQDCYIVNTTYMPCRGLLCHCSCIIYACWPSVAVTNTAVGQTCLLDCCHSISMPADLLLLNDACLLALCFSICYTCWYGVSLSVMSAGIVSHYQPCLLVCRIIIGHDFWFGTSQSAMPVGVVPYYRSCLLVWCLTISHACWRGTSL